MGVVINWIIDWWPMLVWPVLTIWAARLWLDGAYRHGWDMEMIFIFWVMFCWILIPLAPLVILALYAINAYRDRGASWLKTFFVPTMKKDKIKLERAKELEDKADKLSSGLRFGEYGSPGDPLYDGIRDLIKLYNSDARSARESVGSRWISW